MQMTNDNYDINDPANDDLIVSESMNNMFNIITKRETYDSIVEKNNGRMLMIYNPLTQTPDIDELIDTLIDYYSSPDIEMYERCAELVKIKNDESSADDFIDFDFVPDWDIEDNDR